MSDTSCQISNKMRASILTEALPYVKRYHGKIVVIKYGGNAMLDLEHQESVMNDIAFLLLIGVKVVLVHGGGPEINDMLKRVGKESKFLNGLRVTDKETVDIVQMVLAGKVNKDIVNILETAGNKAVGICGIDGGMIKVSQVNEELGYVGEIESINTQIIHDLLDKDYVPVISTVGMDDNGNVYNINADTAAARIAGELKAECFITLTNIAGIMKDKDDPSTLIHSINVSETPRLIKEGVVSGGMIPKIESCVDAIRRGVSKVFIIDGRVQHSIILEMLTDEGMGTMLK